MKKRGFGVNIIKRKNMKKMIVPLFVLFAFSSTLMANSHAPKTVEEIIQDSKDKAYQEDNALNVNPYAIERVSFRNIIPLEDVREGLNVHHFNNGDRCYIFYKDNYRDSISSMQCIAGNSD